MQCRVVPLHLVYHLLQCRWRITACFLALLGAFVVIHQMPLSGSDFPKIACPSSAGFRAPPREYKTEVRLIRQLGNWTFEEPAWLTSVCRASAEAMPPTSSRGSALPSMRRTLLAIVPVIPRMSSSRLYIRETWGADLNRQYGQVLFLVQLSAGQDAPADLSQEQAEYQDILLAHHSGADSFDSYGLLVRKMLSVLHWYANTCHSGFDFVLKADLDSYWNVASLVNLLRRHQPSEPLVLGSVQEKALVTRDPTSKFYISTLEYPNKEFPTYASGGPGYVLSRAAVLAIASEAERNVPLTGALWLEDVYITGILPALAISAPQNKQTNATGKTREFLHLHSDYIFICRYADLSVKIVKRWPPLAMHQVQGQELRDLHSGVQYADRMQRLHQIVYSKSSCSDGH